MPLPIFGCVIGADRKLRLTLRDSNNDPVTTFTTAATVACEVWGGDGTAAATATVDKSEIATGVVTVTIPAATTATFSQGLYRGMLEITAGGITTMQPVFGLEMIQGPNDDAPLPVYCTLDDMRLVAGGIIDNLMEDSDRTGFEEQRHRARIELDRIIQSHYPGNPLVVRQNSLDHLLDGGTYRTGYQDTSLQDALDADGLVLIGPTGQTLVRWNALMACAYVFDRQIGQDGTNAYSAHAGRMRREASSLLCGLVAGVDTNDDGTADLAINLGLVDTLRA